MMCKHAENVDVGFVTVLRVNIPNREDQARGPKLHPVTRFLKCPSSVLQSLAPTLIKHTRSS